MVPVIEVWLCPGALVFGASARRWTGLYILVRMVISNVGGAD